MYCEKGSNYFPRILMTHIISIFLQKSPKGTNWLLMDNICSRLEAPHSAFAWSSLQMSPLARHSFCTKPKSLLLNENMELFATTFATVCRASNFHNELNWWCSTRIQKIGHFTLCYKKGWNPKTCVKLFFRGEMVDKWVWRKDRDGEIVLHVSHFSCLY